MEAGGVSCIRYCTRGRGSLNGKKTRDVLEEIEDSGIRGDAEEFEFKPVEPEPIPGAEEIPKMDFVPLGMEEPVVREPTREDLEPLRKVEVRPVDYLRSREERSLFLSIRKYRPKKLPFSNTNIFVLQLTAMIALFITITVNFYINSPENGILGEVQGFEGFLVWNTSFGASVLAIFCGTAIGGLAAYIKGMDLQKKSKLYMYLMQIIAASIAVIPLFVIIVALFSIEYLDFNNLELFTDYVMLPSVYFLFLLIFSSAVIFGVFGLLTGQAGPISLSTVLIFLQIFLSFNYFAIESNDLVGLFREESRITLFSIAYLAYVELSFAVSRFARDWRRTSRYDHRTGATTFTSLLGKTINLYIVFFIGIIIATYLMAMFSTHLDDLFSYFITPAMRDSIEHSTIYGKLMFVLLFFGLIALLKGIIPAKEYIKGKMNVTAEEIEVPMTIVEGRG